MYECAENDCSIVFYADLTLSFLGNESGLISSFLSSEELGELLDKVHLNTAIVSLKYTDWGKIDPTQGLRLTVASYRCSHRLVKILFWLVGFALH